MTPQTLLFTALLCGTSICSSFVGAVLQQAEAHAVLLIAWVLHALVAVTCIGAALMML